MPPNAEEDLLVTMPRGSNGLHSAKERLRPPTYNAEDYAIALRRWGRRALAGQQQQDNNNANGNTLPSTCTSSSSGYASANPGEMTLRQFTSVSELLNKLRADLRLAFPSFVQEFASPPAEGISLLLETLRGVQLSQSTPPSATGSARRPRARRAALDELGCVECLAACTERCPDAARILAQAQPGLLALAVCLTSSLNRTRVLALQMVKTLLRRGAKINNFDAINRSPLYMAIKNKNPDMVRLLLQQGATVANNTNLMVLILSSSDTRLLEILLEDGQLMDVKNEEGENLLQVAVKCNSNKFLRLMVEHGFDPCQVTNGSTFLHVTTEFGNYEALQFFLKYDIDANVYDFNGRTAMHLLIDFTITNRLPMLQELLLHGANSNVVDEKEKMFTPLDRAVCKKCYSKNERLSDDIDLDNCIELLLTTKTDYSDLLDKRERREYKDNDVTKLFTKYFIKRQICGLNVDERISELFETPIEPNFQDECIEELKRLREVEVSKKFSLYDVLRAEYKGDLLELVELQKFHEVFESMINKFPLYQNILLWRYISAKRRQFIGVVRKSLDALFRSSLPTLVIDRIIEHLSEIDKRRVINTVTFKKYK